MRKNRENQRWAGSWITLRHQPELGGRVWLHVFLQVSFAVLLVPAARGQLYTGSLTGVVTDPSGAVIPNAALTATDTGKGFQYKATTDAAGRYLLRPLPPATYKLTVEATGFRTSVQEGVTLDVNQMATVNVTLQVGATTQTVEVTAAAPLLASQDAVTGQEVSRNYINDIPLIGRSVFDLAFLAPGVSPAPGQSFGTGLRANNFVSNGERNIKTDILVDGVSTTGYEDGTGGIVPLYVPSVDAVQEFKVQQNNFGADKGFSGGTIVNVVMRSGTNQFHGSAYEFVRNQIWDANNWFNNANGIKIPALRYNNFGGTFGGPIQKGKTFFFADYEGTRTRTLSAFAAGVPSAAERNGDFAEVCAANGGAFDSQGLCSSSEGQLWDPYSGVYNASEGGADHTRFIPFNNLALYQSPGNANLVGTPYQLAAVAGNLIDPVSAKMIQYFPAPNKGSVGSAGYNPFNNWAGTGAGIVDSDQFDIRIDRQFTRDLVSGRYSQGRAPVTGASCFPNALDPCSQGPNWRNPHAFVLNDTHTFSPATVMTLSYGYTRLWTESDSSSGSYPDFSPVTTLGLPTYILESGFKASPAVWGLGNYQGVAGSQNIGAQTWSILRYPQETHDLLGSIDHMMGRHELKYGAEGRMHRVSFTQPGTPGGLFSFNNYATSQFAYAGGGDGMASFLTGTSPSGWGQYEIPGTTIQQSFRYAGYALDNWRATDKLTLNVGVRYEIEAPRTERHNRLEWFDPNLTSPLKVPALPNLKGGLVYASSSQRAPLDMYTRGISPRFGLAYRLSPRTVFRGGYGIFFNPSTAGGGSPILDEGYNKVTSYLTVLSDGATPWSRVSNPLPTGPLQPTGNTLGALTDVGTSTAGPLRKWNQAPYTQTWSVGFQHELSGNLVVDANYVGTKGTHLYFGDNVALNFLGSWVETASADELTALNTKVTNPFYGVITDPNSSLSGPQVGASQLMLPFPQFTGVTGIMAPWGNSSYHALQLRAQKNLSHGVEFLASYIISKTISDSDEGGAGWLGGFGSLTDPNNRRLERSISEYDIPQVLTLSYVIQLPVGRGRRWGSTWSQPLNALLGGWQTNGLWRIDNGQPVALSYGGNTPLPFYSQRADLLGPLHRNHGPNWMTQYFSNPEEIRAPAPYTIGTAPRELPNVRVPGTSTAGLSLFKEIPLSKLREGMRLQYRLESYNAFNHPQFCGPNASIPSTFVASDPTSYASFGQVSSQCNSPREVQMALKLYW